MSILKKLAGETALYGVSSILGRSVNFILVPLYTYAFVEPESQGVIVKLYALVAFLNVLYTFGMETTYFRFASRQKDQQQSYFNQTLSAVMVVSVVFSSIIALFSESIATELGYPDRANFVTWLAIIIAIDAIVAIPYARLRLENKAKIFVRTRLINIFANVGLSFFFLWFCKDITEGKMLPSWLDFAQFFYNPAIGVGYIIIANLISNALFFPLMWRLFAKFKFEYNPEKFKVLWNYGYPILILGLAGITNQMTDRLMLEKFLPENFYPNRSSADALGIYGNCYKLSIFISLAIQSFKFAADPFFFSKAEDRNAPKVFAEVSKWFIIVCVIIWVGTSLNLDVIGHFALRSPKYREGLGVVSILMLGNLFLGVYYNVAVWFKLSDKTYYGTVITLAGAALNIALNYVLIPKYGYTGCAYSFLISSFVMTALCWWLGEKHFPVPYDLFSAFKYIGSGWLLIELSARIHIENLWISVPYHCTLLLLYLLIILVWERKTLRRSQSQSPPIETSNRPKGGT